jgi:hypothetical protein
MIPYIVVLIALLVVPFFIRRFLKNSKLCNWLISVFCFGLIYLLFALKNTSVGIDTAPAYLSSFNFMKSGNWNGRFNITNEPGFWLTMLAFAKMNTSYYLFQSFIYLIVVVPFAIFSAKLVKLPELVALGFYCLDLFNASASAIRQACAIGIITLGTFFFLFFKRKYLKFLFFYLCVFVAFTFHKSSIIAIIIPILLSIKQKPNSFIFMSCIVYVITICLTPGIYEYLYPFSNPYYPGVTTGNFPTFSVFLFLFALAFAVFHPNGSLINNVENWFIARFNKQEVPIITDNPVVQTTENYSLFESCLPLIVVASIGMLISIVSYAGTRLSYFFIIFLPVAASEYCGFAKNQKFGLFLQIVFSLVFCAFFAYTFLYKDPLNEVPYVFL